MIIPHRCIGERTIWPAGSCFIGDFSRNDTTAIGFVFFCSKQIAAGAAASRPSVDEPFKAMAGGKYKNLSFKRGDGSQEENAGVVFTDDRVERDAQIGRPRKFASFSYRHYSLSGNASETSYTATNASSRPCPFPFVRARSSPTVSRFLPAILSAAGAFAAVTRRHHYTCICIFTRGVQGDTSVKLRPWEIAASHNNSMNAGDFTLRTFGRRAPSSLRQPIPTADSTRHTDAGKRFSVLRARYPPPDDGKNVFHYRGDGRFTSLNFRAKAGRFYRCPNRYKMWPETLLLPVRNP